VEIVTAVTNGYLDSAARDVVIEDR